MSILSETVQNVNKTFAELLRPTNPNDDDTPLSFERNEALVDWFYAEKDKLDRGEASQLKLLGHIDHNEVLDWTVPRWISAHTVLRQKLLETGYAPIPVNGKVPPLEEWQKKSGISHQEIISWDTNPKTCRAHNTGLLGVRTPGVDIDIHDAAAADAVEQMVRERFKDRGAILVRIGRPPKRLIPFQTAVAFEKILAVLDAPDGSQQRIEFLGKGQQFVAFGTHPETHQPYQWGDAGTPGENIKLDELPEISADEAKQLVDDIVELLITQYGYRRATSKPKLNGGGDGKIISPFGKFGNQRNTSRGQQLNEAALKDFTTWVPELFPAAEPYHEGFRLAPEDRHSHGEVCHCCGRLWSEHQEAISFHPTGIVDYAVGDEGDPKAGKRTPIEVIMEHVFGVPAKDLAVREHTPEFEQAFDWLSARVYGEDEPKKEEPFEKTEENEKRVIEALPTSITFAQWLETGEDLKSLHWPNDWEFNVFDAWSKAEGYNTFENVKARWNVLREGSIYRLLKKGKKKTEELLPEFKSYFLEELQQRPLVPVQWIVENFIVARTLNGFFGDGGIGKDLALLQLAIAMTCNGKWLGYDVKQGRVLYFPVEDDEDELRRREHNITRYLTSLGLYHPMPKQLKIVPLLGEKTLLGYYDPSSGLVCPTDEYAAICKMIEEFKPDLVIVGNRVNIFGVNQNDDSQARQCIQLLMSICKTYQTTVIMPSHVSLNRSGADQGTSGSVQWNNGCRMRNYLRKPKADDDEESKDTTARELEVMKANYAPTGQMIKMNWIDGVFQPDKMTMEKVEREQIDPQAEMLADEEEVLRMLDALIKGAHVSPNPTAPNNIFKKFLKGRFKGHRGKLEAAVKRLYDNGVLDTAEVGPPSRRTSRVIRKQK